MNLINWGLNLSSKRCVNSAQSFFTVVVVALCSFGVLAQCDPPELDATINFEQPEDYRRASKSALAAIDWLLTVPLAQCEEDRNRLNAYVLVWLGGHPDVRVELETSVFPFFEEFPELLFPVIFAMGRYDLKHPNEGNNLINQHVAAMQTVLEIADREKKYRANSDIKMLRKMRRKDHLSSYVSGLLDQ